MTVWKAFVNATQLYFISAMGGFVCMLVSLNAHVQIEATFGYDIRSTGVAAVMPLAYVGVSCLIYLIATFFWVVDRSAWRDDIHVKAAAVWLAMWFGLGVIGGITSLMFAAHMSLLFILFWLDSMLALLVAGVVVLLNALFHDVPDTRLQVLLARLQERKVGQ